MRDRYSYDMKCKELADYFLGGEAHTDEELADLAQAIQDAIENFFAAWKSHENT